LCSASDKENRPLVTDLLKEYRGKRLFTIGRLDFNSEGLIILTNDGEFASKVGHPSSGPVKTYQVRVRGVPDEANLEQLRRGIRVKNYKTRPAEVQLRKAQKNAWLEVTLKEGRNRQLRNMFETIGHPVVKLRRIRIGSLTTAGMKPGDYRLLTDNEIVRLSKP
jgi:pseudouridine synthase